MKGSPALSKTGFYSIIRPGSMLEGMIIAGYTVGASYGIIYLRSEYWWLEEKIQQEIVAFRSKGLLGPNAGGIKGFRFDIRVEMGAGAYVCGEETALIESLEGSRGEPRTKWQFPLERKYRQLLIGENNVEPRAKWYFPVERGYLQLPTVVNNVETFCLVARLLQLGLPEYLSRGISVSPGTKLISISGDCRLPGIYEIEWGKTISELLERCQAENPYLMQVSGPSGQSISMAESKYQICMPGSGIQDSITCGGSLMIFNQQNDLLKILLNFAEFFKHESCGVCTPCRAGNFIIQRKLTQLLHGIGDLNDLEDLKKWAGIMEASSRCGLGKTSGNAIIHTIDKFQGYFSARFPATDSHGIRAFDIAAAIAEYDHFKPTSS
jgi:[NiFe] hydrogenase diaphorase moiety large subunit